MSIKQRLYYNVCVFIYKILNNMPVSMNKSDNEELENESQRLTKQTRNIVLDFSIEDTKSIFYENVKMYNCQLGIAM